MNNKQSVNKINTEKSIAQAKEMQATINQWCDLRQQGKYNEAADFWAKSQKKDEALNKEITDQIKGLNPRKNSQYPKSNPLALTLVIIFFVFVFGGIIFNFTIGETFIFAWPNNYNDLAVPVLYCLFPIFFLITILHEIKFHSLRKKYPYKGFRKLLNLGVHWFLIVPFFIAFGLLVLYITPLGWVAFSGWVSGSYTNNMEAKIISIDPYHYSKRGCNQRAKLEFRGNNASICTDGVIVGNTPQPNEKVLIVGQVSWFGIYIQQIRTQSQ